MNFLLRFPLEFRLIFPLKFPLVDKGTTKTPHDTRNRRISTRRLFCIKNQIDRPNNFRDINELLTLSIFSTPQKYQHQEISIEISIEISFEISFDISFEISSG